MARTGRPSKLDQVVRHRPAANEGDPPVPVTAAEQIIDRVALGLDLAVAADSAGIDRSTLHRWTVAGARHRATQAQGKLPRPTTRQQQLIDFCNDLERAQAEAEANRLAIINRAATGGAVVTKTTEKRDNGGNLVERTVVTETLAPQWTAAAWWLERRRGYVKRYELTGAAGTPLVPQAEAARDLADSLRDWLTSDADAQAEAAEQVKASRTKAQPDGG